MNAKTLLFVAAIAASANVFAQPNGRDSVYAHDGASANMSSNTSINIQGRSSVYAGDLPAPVHASEHAAAAVGKFGRA
ncbi:MAG TPA: hypothetical protein VFA81_11020 [Burkholderiales bacterium]|nr:hypothetical protein [Burkholderiales bacterium]